MTLQEAIKSGRPFKRSSWRHWYYLENGAGTPSAALVNCRDQEQRESLITVHDFLATDWEIQEEEKRELTWVEICKAFNAGQERALRLGYETGYDEDTVKQALGFKD